MGAVRADSIIVAIGAAFKSAQVEMPKDSKLKPLQGM